MMFCFKSVLQIWIILIGFRDTNDFVNLGICKHEFKFTCRDYCRFTLISQRFEAYKLNWLILIVFCLQRKFIFYNIWGSEEWRCLFNLIDSVASVVLATGLI